MLGRTVLAAILLAFQGASRPASNDHADDVEETWVVPAPAPAGDLTREDLVLSIIEGGVRGPCRQERPVLSEIARRPCRYWITLPDGAHVTTPPGWGCRILPAVKARVEAIREGRFRYWYAVRNERRAEDRVGSFALDLPRGDILLDRSDGGGWLLLDLGGVPLYLGRLQEKTGHPVAMWAPRRRPEEDYIDAGPLSPGEHLGHLSVTSAYLPALTTARFTGDVCLGESPKPEEVPAWPIPGVRDVSFCVPYEITRVTIGPMLPPAEAAPSRRTAVLTRLDGEIGIALGARWIEGPQAQELSSRLKAAAGETAPGDLSALAAEIETMSGLAVDYRLGLVTTLRTLEATH